MLAACSRRLATRSALTVRPVASTIASIPVVSRSYSSSEPWSKDYPYHIVVGMPALSPTMETGILAEWYIQEGSSFAAGEAIAKIETDKASIDFEAQDDGYVAKILMEAGSGADIPVNTPIMITVEDESDVAAFHDYVLESSSSTTAVAAAAAPPTPAPAVAASTTPVPPAPVAPPAPTPVTVAAPVPSPPAPVAAVPPPSMEALMAAVAPVMSTGWGEFAKLNSPIIRTLSKQQNAYISKYGTTGQLPL